MKLLAPFRRLPLAFRVPALVSLLMIVISAAISERVLSRLERSQEQYLDGLAATYLDGLVSSITPSVLSQDSWEIFDAIERLAPSANVLRPVETIVATNRDVVLASGDPGKTPTLAFLDNETRAKFPVAGIAVDAESGLGHAMRIVRYQNQDIGRVYATFDASGFLAERREVLLTLLTTNMILAFLFGLAGFGLVRRMIRPMQVLESHMNTAAAGLPSPVSEDEYRHGDTEARRMFAAYNALVKAGEEREQFANRLAEEEKLASLGRLASGMAHEINNPLGGLMNAVDTLKKHGGRREIRDASLSLIERGLIGIREVVQAALATYRPERLKRTLSASDFADIRLLVGPELRSREQELVWDIDDACLPERLPAGPIRQAVLNLLLNASAATPPGGMIGLRAVASPDAFILEITDQGPGLPEAHAAVLVGGDPGPAVAAGSGLGLWVVRNIAEELGASIETEYAKGGGTVIRIVAPTQGRELSHAA